MFNINWFFFTDIKWSYFFNLYILGYNNLLDDRLIDKDFYFFDDLLAIRFNEMCHLNENFFLNFFDELLLNGYWNFNEFWIFFDVNLDYFFNDFRDRFDDLSSFFDNFRNLFNELMDFRSSNNVGNFLLNFNVNRFFH